jgi:hypothetical protein
MRLDRALHELGETLAWLVVLICLGLHSLTSDARHAHP